jgi:L-aspartate oxidase
VSAAKTQVAVVGAGAAGLYAALCAAREGVAVTLVSATSLAESSSFWAQGGLAAALADDDSPELHLNDTVLAGRGAVRESAAQILCREAPAAVAGLESLGIVFDRATGGELAFSLEGGHSVRRVVHAGGASTGQRIVGRLAELVAAAPDIQVLEGQRVTRVLVADNRVAGLETSRGTQVAASATILATGGTAAMWARTTNPPGASGTGLLLAHAAGAELADLEMLQFHPTAVVGENGADGFLVTEAVRGEGARLLDAGGERFVDELAPRDEVARAVQRQLVSSGATAVGLDMRDVDPDRFPNVVSRLRAAGLDPVRDLIPVAPAAHYMMGGITTDLEGRATLPGLYAVGECACTGLHGANRLASNSLTECFVFGARAARAASAQARRQPPPRLSTVARGPRTARGALSEESRRALWRDAGLERDAAGLGRLKDDPHPLVRLIGASGLARAESRGAHQRTDHPAPDPRLEHLHVTVGTGGETRLERWD